MIKNKIILLAFIFSILLTYNYYDFKYNMSIGVGHAYTAKSIALSRNFNVDEYWGNAGVDVIDYNNHKYVAYAPLNAIIMSIPYFTLQVIYFLYTKFNGSINGNFSILLESIALKLPATFFYVIIGVLIAKLLKKYAISKRNITITLIAFFWGTIFFNYSVTFFNHITAAFFIFLAYYFLDKTESKKNYAIAGILAGLAFLTEFPTIFFGIAILFKNFYSLCFEKKKVKNALTNLTYFYIPIAISISLIGIFNWIHFDNPFLMSERILFEQKSFLGTQHTFSQNPFYGLWGLYLSPLKGLLLISPFIFFAIPGFKKYYDLNKPNAILGITYIIFVSILYSTWPDCFGATVFGPRYLITIIPFLVFYSTFGIRNKSSYLIYTILAAYSIYICLFNLLDGLPSGTWFGIDSCNTLNYASFFKANSYLGNLLDGEFRAAPFLIKLISQ